VLKNQYKAIGVIAEETIKINNLNEGEPFIFL